MAALARVIGTLVLALLLVALLGLLVVAARVALYEQVEPAESLERKRLALERMTDGVDPDAPRPNVVLIFFDDLGYGDLGSFGSRALATPRIDSLAAEGIALDHFYAAAPLCTPSRAGLLTGRWPARLDLGHVYFPTGSNADRILRALGRDVRLPADEVLLPEALRLAGYATGMVGKWHLGDHSPSLPTELGFESYFGMLYSNDMVPAPLHRGTEEVDAHPVDQTTLVARYDEEAIEWLESHAGETPFFLYYAHNFPHIPLYASAEQAGKSLAGPYGDVMADLDRSVGRILDTLERLAEAGDTLVIVTSDNGPWFQGSRGAVRGRKNMIFEGGQRVPFIARWPGRIPRGVRSDAVTGGVDLFPTLLRLAGVPLPADRTIDGEDLMAALEGRAFERREPIFGYSGTTLLTARTNRFKAHRRHGVFGGYGETWPFGPMLPKGPWLFDLPRDPDESYDVGARHPDELQALLARMDAQDESLARNPRGWID